MRMRPYIQKGAQSLNDFDALEIKRIYPQWVSLIGHEAAVGFKFLHSNDLYRVLQAHAFQNNWIPGVGTESLYARIDESHAGTIDDPIPYSGNMALVKGVYYEQYGIIYLCTRDTVNPVYNALSELVGHYVEAV